VGGRLVLLVIEGVELRVRCGFFCAMLRRGEWEGILLFFHINEKVLEKRDGPWYFGKKGRLVVEQEYIGVLILLYLSRQPEPFSKKTPSGGSSSSSCSSSPYIFGPFSLHHPVFFSLRSQPTRVLRVA